MLGYVGFVVKPSVIAVQIVEVRLIGTQQNQCVMLVGGLNNDETVYLFKKR